jgi:putative zinc finger/helix-turn-helix YgiT family protein
MTTSNRLDLDGPSSEPHDGNPALPECPDCDSSEFTVQDREQSFIYGRGDSGVKVCCVVPTYVCSNCGCEWTGVDAEEIRHDAVCRCLRRLTPREILDIRESASLTQAEFGRITGFGEASLSRWETGSQIQNAACDRLLRLIFLDVRNLHRLRQLADSERASAQQYRVVEITPELRRRQKAFQLRGALLRRTG